MDFYAALGFTNNPQFSDDAGKCMVWSGNIFVMLLTYEKFTTFAAKPIADTKSKLGGLFSLSLGNIDAVNSIMAERTIEDFDGHTWDYCSRRPQ
ncbi:MAG: hypothetical protein H6563_01250 [Lewinellaceae bacterium]|nr:hypothetical protein [Lewinellaceae bacterium]